MKASKLKTTYNLPLNLSRLPFHQDKLSIAQTIP